MYEYGVINTKTNKQEVLFGYNLKDACRRANVEAADYEVEYMEYID